MAINDISLSAGMRSNLLGLQNTVTLLERTQQRLSSGNKVNSALDNPTSFFASQVLNSRAAKIDSLKDAMGQAIQTVQAADKGIKGITSLIEQAKGVAQSAQSATASSGFSTVTITLASIVAGDQISLIGSTTAVLTVADTTATVASIDIVISAGNNVTAADTVIVGGRTYVFSVGGTSEGYTSVIGATTADTATNLQGLIVANQAGEYTATISAAGTVHIVGNSVGLTANTITEGVHTNDDAVTLTNNAGTPIAAPGTNVFVRSGDNTVDAMNLAKLINNETGAYIGAFNNALTSLYTEGYRASASNGVVTISKIAGTVGGVASAATNVTETANVTEHAVTMVAADVAASGELSSLMDQYNAMRTQITALAEDSGYKGKNLLSATETSRVLTVTFENSHLDVTGFNATAGATASDGLKITAATWTTGDAAAITAAIAADLVLLDNALTTLRSNASSLSGNLSIITVRQDFSTNMINTLTEGANKLTLADTNEEGANMLMLQTRQSLGTTALSLSAQAAQSVLRLFA